MYIGSGAWFNFDFIGWAIKNSHTNTKASMMGGSDFVWLEMNLIMRYKE